MKEFYKNHKDFNEYCEFNKLDKDKITKRLQEVFFEGMRKGGSWECQVLESIFNFEEFYQEYKKTI